MSGEIQINTARITKHGHDLTAQIVPQLEKARSTLNDIDLEGGDFSITGNMASMAYPGALQFAFEDLKTHEDMVKGFAQTVDTSAKNWQSGEDHSTVKQV